MRNGLIYMCAKLIWTGEDPRVQETLNEEQFRSRVTSISDASERAFFLNHVYCYDGVAYALHDDSKYTNHSKKEPVMTTAALLAARGVKTIPFGREPTSTDCFASRDVAVGEEITDDYRYAMCVICL